MIKNNLILIITLVSTLSCSLISFEEITFETFPNASSNVINKNDPLWIKFSHPIKRETVESHVTVQSIEGNVSGNLKWENDKKIIFTPSEEMKPGIQHYLKVNATAQSLDNIITEINILEVFFVETKTKSLNLLSYNHNEGDDVPVSQPLIFTFSDSVNTTTIQDGFTLSPSADDLSYSWTNSNKELSILPASNRWEPSTIYAWTLSSEIEAASNIPLSQSYSSSFATQIDNEAPTVSSHSFIDPSTGLTSPGCLSDSILEIVFSEPIEYQVLTSPVLTISPNVTGSEYWVDNTTLRFIPSDYWEQGNDYFIEISPDVKDISGVAYYPDGDANTPIEIASSVPYLESTEIQLTNNAADVSQAPTGNSFDTPLTISIDPASITIVRLKFSQAITEPEYKQSLLNAISFISYLPTSAVDPTLTTHQWIDDTTLSLNYTNVSSSADQSYYYQLRIEKDLSEYTKGGFLEEDLCLFIETTS